MKILAKTITADTQVFVGDCYFVGAEYSTTACAADKSMIVYNEGTATKTAAQKIATLCNSVEVQADRIVLPLPGLKCDGIYVDWDTAGVGTVYYYI